jgi:hypothetical protein
MEENDIYSEQASGNADSEYSAQSSKAPPFTDEMVIELLQHVETAQSTLLAQEQMHRMCNQEPTLYVRHMYSHEIIDSATTYSTHAPTEAVINIAQASVTRQYRFRIQSSASTRRHYLLKK